MHNVKKLISFLISVILLGVFTLSVFANSGQSPLDYAPPGSLMTLDQKDGTVKKVKQNITGKIKKKDAAQKVTYEVFAAADNGGLTAAGEAELKDGTFSVNDLKLKPDNNRIAVTVQSPGGKTETQTINIHYNAGSIKDVPMKDVAKISGSEMKYVTNNLLVFFDEGTDDARRQAIIDTVGGKCTGFVDGINMWQVEVKRGTYEQLRKTAEKLKMIDGVFDAQLNMAQAAKTMITVPNDPWYNNQSPPWTELNPYGGNWSIEVIQALSAWDYQYFYKNIKVGIVDAGVQNDHVDLAGKVFFPDAQSQTDNDPTDDHGTHVAGIMGAIPNNGKGVTGILWDTVMYAYNWDTLAGTDAHLMLGLTKTVQAGAKVVNFSLGLADDISYLGPPETNQKVKDYAALSKDYMYPLLQAGHEFIVVQSAGNGQGGYSQDAIYNGYFCSVTYTNLTGISTEMVQKINERIIVVGSAYRYSQGVYRQATTSNAGSQVDICAPGVDVYSCYAGNSYWYMSGTSMAAPVVTGVAALAWSVNPALTGAQVRNIVLNNTAYVVLDSLDTVYHPLNNTYNMVNAKLAAEAAISTIPPDYSSVHTAVAAANALNADLYTPASWSALTSAVSAVDYNLESLYQVQINTYAENINTAVANLVFKTVDYTVEYRLNSETGDKVAADKAGTGQVTKTVTEAAPVIGGYAPMTATKQLTLELTGNKIIFIYITQPAYGAVLSTYKNVDGQLIPVTAAAAGDTITVTVTPATNFYCAGSKFVVMYDKNFYTLLGTNNSAFTANTANNYYINTVTSFSGTVSHPPASWPSTFTGGENALYNYITTAYYAGAESANGGFPNIMNDGQWLFSFRLKVNTGAAGTGRIFMDHRWTKTDTNSTGIQYFNVCANETVPNTAGNAAMNLLPDLTLADRGITLVTPVTVSFSLNGGSGTLPEPQVGIPGMPFVLPAQGDFTREHYTFAGWALTPDAAEPLASFSYPESDCVLYAVWQSVPAVLNCGAEPAAYDENGFIVGIAPGTAKSAFTVNGDYRLEFSTAGTTVGTGTVITIVSNVTSEPVSMFTVVIFGDVNGDGLIDSLDAGLAVDHENYLVPWSDPSELCFRTAADANGDGSRDSIDAGLMVDTENYIASINQNRGVSPG